MYDYIDEKQLVVAMKWMPSHTQDEASDSSSSAHICNATGGRYKLKENKKF